MYLSKSIYVNVWSCPKGAWIRKYHPEAVPQDESRLSRFRQGDEVGDLARGLFGPSVNVTAYREDGKLDLPKMMENTAAEMERGTEVICEASFSYEGLYCAVDLLRREKDGWAIYEVKSSSDGLQDNYIADVSYQKFVLEHCGVKVTGVLFAISARVRSSMAGISSPPSDLSAVVSTKSPKSPMARSPTSLPAAKRASLASSCAFSSGR